MTHGSVENAMQSVRTRFETQVETRMAVFDWIEGCCDPRQRYSSIRYLSPNEFEATNAPSSDTTEEP